MLSGTAPLRPSALFSFALASDPGGPLGLVASSGFGLSVSLATRVHIHAARILGWHSLPWLESSAQARKMAQCTGCSEHLLFLLTSVLSPNNITLIFLWEATFSPTGSPQANQAISAPGHSDWFRAITRVIVCSGYYNKTPETGWLKQQTFICHSSRSREVQDQGADRSSV